MTDFKAGDRVRYTGKSKEYSRKSSVGAVGTVSGCDSGYLGTSRVEWDRDGGTGDPQTPATVVYNGNLELVAAGPKIGDKIRVTYEGEVTHVYKPDGALEVGGAYVSSPDKAKVEVLERKIEPLAVGSVVSLWAGENPFGYLVVTEAGVVYISRQFNDASIASHHTATTLAKALIDEPERHRLASR